MQNSLFEVLSSKNQESLNQELTKYTNASCIGEDLTLEQATKLSIALKANSTLQSLNLAITNLNDDSVRVIANALETNTTLTELDLSQNPITIEGFRSLRDALAKNRSLKTLYLFNIDKITKKKEPGKTLVLAEILENSSLESLDLTLNNLQDEDAIHLSNALTKNRTLTNLNLSSNQIGELGITKIAESLRINRSLKKLALTNNPIGDNGLKEIAETLKQNTSLSDLQLDNTNVTENGIQYLAEALQTNQTLAYLDLENNNLSEKSLNTLFDALAKRKATTPLSLNLRNNLLTESSSKNLSHILEKNANLSILDLSLRKIETGGVQKIAQALIKNTKLKTLILQNNDLSSQSITDLANALKQNNSLHFLDLGNNTITSEGIVALAEMLKTNTTLEGLRLTHRRHAQESISLSDKDLDTLLSAIENNSNSGIKFLDLSYWNISQQGMNRLVNSLKKNTKITCFMPPYCYELNHDEYGRLIATMLETNTTLTHLEIKTYYDAYFSSEIQTRIDNSLQSNLKQRNLKQQNLEKNVPSFFTRLWNWLKNRLNAFKQMIETNTQRVKAKFWSTTEQPIQNNPISSSRATRPSQTTAIATEPNLPKTVSSSDLSKKQSPPPPLKDTSAKHKH